jgi:DNA-binding MarR family transcriptional regulator
MHAMEGSLMPQADNVQDTHIPERMKALHGALLTIGSVMNRPSNDERLIAAAGIRLDRALFRLLVVIERLGPIGVVELADRLGRDYTTVSRQVAKLDAMGLITRRGNAQDRRVREALIAPPGKAMTDRLDAARARMAREVFAGWPEQDVADLVRLMVGFAAALERMESVGG